MTVFEPITTPLKGSVLIEANAGTGKTYTLALMYVRLILEEKLLPQNILVVTFTRAATQELRQRLRQKLESLQTQLEHGNVEADPSDQALLDNIEDKAACLAHLRLALLSFDQCCIYTIHGFCEVVLQKYQSQVSLPPMDVLVANDAELRLQYIYRFWRQFAPQLDAWMIAYLTSQNIHPQPTQHNKLIAAVDEVLNKPGLHEQQNTADNQNLAEILTHVQQMRMRWLKDRPEVLNQLQQLGFNKNSVIGKDLQRCMDAVDTLMDSGARHDDVAYLGIEKIRKALPKAQQSVDLVPFHAALDALLKVLDTLPVVIARLCVDFVKLELHKRKQNTGIYVYDDQITYVAYMLQHNNHLGPQLAQQYQAIMVDEFQDTDQRQYQIFKNIHKHAPNALFAMVGDPKQSIYGFRGADVYAYQAAKKAVDQEYRLTTNWRSVPAVIDFINDFYNQHQVCGLEPFDIPWITHVASLAAPTQHVDLHDPLYKKTVIYAQPQDDSYRHWLVAELQRLLSGEVLLGDSAAKAQDIAILVHSNRLADAYYELLLKHNIPAVLWSDKSIFSTPLAYAYYVLLEALLTANPKRIKALLLTELIGETLESIVSADFHALSAVFVDYRYSLEHSPLSEVLNRFYVDFGVDQQLLSRLDGERLLTDREHLHELITEREQQGLTTEAIIQWLAVAQQQTSEFDDAHRRRLESDQRSVSIITIHKAKGLEFPVVILPELHHMQVYPFRQSMVMPIHQDGQSRLIWQPDKENKEQYWQQSASEQLRLLYVAMTRACQRLYMINQIPMDRQGEQKPKSNQVIAQRVQTVMGSESLSAWLEEPVALEASQYKAIAQGERSQKTILNQLQRTLAEPLQVHSYSEIHQSQPKSHTLPELPSVADAATAQLDIFTFPRGAMAGSCLHEIMEFVDPHSDSMHDTIERILNRYSIDLKWMSVVSQHTRSVFSKQLVEDMTLDSCHNLLKEMDFLLPIDSVPDALIGSWLSRTRGQNISFENQSLHGYLTGSIDLFFKHQERYYILDYKSNHLGDAIAAYDMPRMQQEIEAHDYDLQYLLYTVAAVKHIQQIEPNFDYDAHFGGVIYLFLRGVNDANDNGIYFHKPDQALVEDMVACFQ